MRVRTAKAEVTKGSGLDALFRLCATRRVAIVFGSGHIYSDLQTVARRHGYETWSLTNDGANTGEGEWFATRADLISAVSGWDEKYVAFEPNVEGLGEVVLRSEDKSQLFIRREDIKAVTGVDAIDAIDFTYHENVYSVPSLKDS